MVPFTRWLTPLGLVLAGWLVACPPASAQKDGPPRKVRDGAGLFSEVARDKANEQIAEIKRRFGKDLVIETVDNVKRPPDLDLKNKEQVNKFFTRLAEERFADLRINGVLIFLVDIPKSDVKKLRIEVGKKTRDGGLFTKNDRQELEEKLIAKLKEGKKDEALTTATSFVLNRMRENAPTAVKEKTRPVGAAVPPAGGQRRGAAPAPAESGIPPWVGYVCVGLVVLLVVWLVIAVIRALTNRGSPGYGYGGGGGGYGGGGGGGGGGFFSSLLGGMFGAAAGMWMYSHFFGGSTPTAHGGDFGAGAGGAAGGGAADAGGGDYGNDAGQVGDGGGGDYGNDAGGGGGGGGGGDWGGGDAGGGGGGGGDWGGGGGGGGGDWGGGGGGGGDWGGGGGGGGDW